MKFQGKGYYEYVHDRLNESLADKLDEPLGDGETRDIAHEIIMEIAEERASYKKSDPLLKSQNLANSTLFGAYMGAMLYSLTTQPPVVAGFIGSISGASWYCFEWYTMNMMNNNIAKGYRKLTPQMRKGKILFTPQRLDIHSTYTKICYDLGLGDMLPEEIYGIHDQGKRIRNRIRMLGSIITSMVAVRAGYMLNHPVMGLTIAAIFGPLMYSVEGTNLLKQPYYKRKIDEGIQRIVEEYQPTADPPKSA